MYAEAYRETANDVNAEELDRNDILEVVASLRDELNLMASDIRSVISENARLRSELEGVRDNRARRTKVSDVHRIKDEIEQLTRMYEAASERRSRLPEERPSYRAQSAGGEERNAWMKKMLMVMMMAEMM